MTLEQTRQQWYNNEISRLMAIHRDKKQFKAYMKAKMEQQLKKGKR